MYELKGHLIRPIFGWGKKVKGLEATINGQIVNIMMPKKLCEELMEKWGMDITLRPRLGMEDKASQALGLDIRGEKIIKLGKKPFYNHKITIKIE
jgi:hypothetical protein